MVSEITERDDTCTADGEIADRTGDLDRLGVGAVVPLSQSGVNGGTLGVSATRTGAGGGGVTLFFFSGSTSFLKSFMSCISRNPATRSRSKPAKTTNPNDQETKKLSGSWMNHNIIRIVVNRTVKKH